MTTNILVDQYRPGHSPPYLKSQRACAGFRDATKEQTYKTNQKNQFLTWLSLIIRTGIAHSLLFTSPSVSL
jgi:hypothetical protein